MIQILEELQSEYLSINNYNVDLASNGIEGYEKFTRSEYDLCILDVDAL